MFYIHQWGKQIKKKLLLEGNWGDLTGKVDWGLKSRGPHVTSESTNPLICPTWGAVRTGCSLLCNLSRATIQYESCLEKTMIPKEHGPKTDTYFCLPRAVLSHVVFVSQDHVMSIVQEQT